MACWNEENELTLYLGPSFKINASAAHSVTEDLSPDSIKVKCAKLDDIMDSIGVEKVDFIKIDVEGAEVEVLQGAEGIIARSDSVKIVFEALDKESFEKCRDILMKHNMVPEHVYLGNYVAVRS